MGWLSKVRRRRAIRRYARLGPLLAKRYGRSETYTQGQIRATAESVGLPAATLTVGYAMFMAKAEACAQAAETGVVLDYDAVRKEVADLCFSGDVDFSATKPAAFDDGSVDGGGLDGGGIGGFDGGAGN